MTLEEYLAAFDEKLSELAGFISASSIQREIDSTLNIGWMKGQIIFVDGSRCEFAEQLPVERRKFRIQ